MSTMAAKVISVTCLLFSVVSAGFTNPGKLEAQASKVDSLLSFQRAMYNGSTIEVQVSCPKVNTPVKLNISWRLTSSPCAQQFATIKDMDTLFKDPGKYDNAGLLTTKFSDITTYDCDLNSVIVLNGTQFQFKKYKTTIKDETSTNEGKEGKSSDVTTVSNQRKRRSSDGEADQKDDNKGEERKSDKTAPVTKDDNKGKERKSDKKKESKTGSQTEADDKSEQILAWKDGIYLMQILIEKDDSEDFNATVRLKMQGPDGGYLDAIDWPLLPFYGTMCAVYAIMALFWMILLCCNWRDLLRIQFWVGAVIFLGMLEKAAFLAEYETINSSGISAKGAILVATLVSCLKRTLARMLVVIVSLGFGIVKPRLGPMLHRVLGIGALYLILSAVEGALRIQREKNDVSKKSMLAEVPLAVLDAAICWWIFTALVDTMRTLRLRRNLVKLSLYRHFTNTLIFAVLASVGYMIWSIVQHKLSVCMTDWKELWVDDAFWHLLFSVILVVIMVLWRPTANNQRYAFSPLLDQADEEAEEPMMNDAFDGMKMRQSANGDTKRKDVSGRGKSPEDDLKWIEENIPASVTDSALPSILDSDDEIMTTRFEMSKME